MNVTCKQRDHVFEDGSPAEWEALKRHAQTCAVCAEEIRAWEALSTAAKELRDYSESSALWTRIEQALAEESTHGAKHGFRWNWNGLDVWQNILLGWRTVAVSACILLLTISAGWLYWHNRGGTAVRSIDNSADKHLLRNNALEEVERTESAYEQAIDKLAIEAKPQLEDPSTPLLVSYREKLLVLDSAIDDLRAQAGQNPSNAHLRYQLLAMYQEKQRTLKEVLEEKP